MSYTALYRRLRPENFDEIIGQGAIVETIKNQILNDRISHAYLFTGTRGTGKTSTARILAKAINCENINDSKHKGNPCGECESCKEISADNSINIIEIDAASNNGVDNIRQINDEVRYTPTVGKYKVYIIDEVHMLSGSAFNALLKTLEEPPAHVKFILATTEPHKIPATILSRCQRYDFKRISTDDIYNTLKAYVEKDKADVEDEALYYIAKSATGAMRDAISLLDQVLALFSGEKLSLNKILELIGGANDADLLEMAENMLDGDIYKSLYLVDKVFKDGVDIATFTSGLIECFRNILIVKIGGKDSAFVEMQGDNLAKISRIADNSSVEILIYIINELSVLQKDMKLAVNTRVLLEVGIVKICTFQGEDREASLEAKLIDIEKKLASGNFASASALEEAVGAKKKSSRENFFIVKSAPEDILKAIENYVDVVEDTDKVLKQFLLKTKPINLGNNTLYIYCYEETIKNYLSQDKTLNIIKNVLIKHFEKDFHVRVIDAVAYNEITGSSLEREQANNNADEIYKQLEKMIACEIKKK